MSQEDPPLSPHSASPSTAAPSAVAPSVFRRVLNALHLPRMAGRAVWRIATYIWVLLAASFLLLRYLVMPEVSSYRAEIAEALSHALGVKVEIAALEAEWKGLRPELHLNGVKLIDTKGREALELPKVDVAVAWSSLIHFRLELHQLVIQHPELVIRREADGHIFIAGLLMEPGGSDSGFADFILSQHEIRIDDARVSWLDQQRGAPQLDLEKLSLLFESSGDTHRFAITAQPASKFSGPLDLRGDLRSRQGDVSTLAAAGWRGTVYLDVERTDLAVWRQWVDYPIDLPRGRGALRAWLNFEGTTVAGLTSDLALSDVQVRFAKDLPMLALNNLSGRLRLSTREDDFSIAAERLTLATSDGLQIPPTRFLVRRNAARAGKPAGGSLSTERLDMRVLTQLASYLPLPPSWREVLRDADPQGVVRGFDVSWRNAMPVTPAPAASEPASEGAVMPEHFELSAAFEGLALRAHDQRPGFSGMSGHVRGNEQQGEYQIEVKDGGLDFPGIMHEPHIALSAAQAVGGWSRQKDGATKLELRRVQFANDDAQDAEFSGYWLSGAGAAGSIDLSGTIRKADANAVWRYMPVVVPADTGAWLKTGLSSGTAENVKLRLLGELDHFPFNKDPKGIFRVEGKFSGLNLDFAPGWPVLQNMAGELLFDRTRMLIRSHSGHYRQVALGEVSAEIADLAHAGTDPLNIVGHASGAGNEMLDYVRASPLAKTLGSFIQHIQAEGSAKLDLKLGIPLSHAEDTRVAGSVHLDGNNSVQIAPGVPGFKAVKGTLGFTENGIAPSQLAAEFMGGTASANGRTLADGTVQFDAVGSIPASGLRQVIDIPLWAKLSGQTQATARITAGKAGAQVLVNTDLQGIASSLPAPLSKSAEARLPFVFAWGLSDEPAKTTGSNAVVPTIEDWRMSLEGRGGAQWQNRCVKEDCSLLRGAAVLNDTLVMPARGFRVSGRFASLDLDRWRPLLFSAINNGQSGSTAAARPTDAAKRGQDLAGAIVQADEVIAGGHRFAKVVARALQQGERWVLRLEGPDVAGDLTWLGEGRGRLNAQLSTLRLHPLDADAVAASQSTPGAAVVDDSEALPALDISAEHFEMRAMQLGKLSLHAENEGPLWRLSQLRIESSDGVIQGSGNSRTFPDGHKRTEVSLQVDSDNVGGLLGRIGFKDTLRKGEAKLHGYLSWDAAATSVDYPSLSGELRLDAEDGQFNKLEPGAGRLLGILSLQSLPRRLTLDFRDVFSEGFAFDSIRADFKLNHGVMRSDNLEVRGPSARVFMKGATDIAHETHDLHITVQPTLSEGLAVGVGAFNPVVGFGFYLAQKILRDPFEKLFSFDYSVTGSWNDPKIEKVVQPVTQSAPSPQ